MSIANELSCDVATALLTPHANSNATSQTDLTELVISFHAALRQLTDEERKRRRRALIHGTPPVVAEAAASGS
ncbi:MAG TPA: hypothetical protein VGW12_06485 [Pyrinomonadaceae bacterium]|nr:hypothetical protein [Pyrinomonadaceae bacterium]